jgi:hypothetical protein
VVVPMSENVERSLSDATRDAIVERMFALAIRRFGTRRAELLRPAIEELAADAALVQLYRLDRWDRPAFFLNSTY